MLEKLELNISNKDTIKQALKNLGHISMFIAMEELAELQKGISKMERHKGDRHSLTEELGDVFMAMTWVMNYYGISQEEVQECITKKDLTVQEKVKRGEKS